MTFFKIYHIYYTVRQEAFPRNGLVSFTGPITPSTAGEILQVYCSIRRLVQKGFTLTYTPNNSNTGPSYPPSASNPAPPGQLPQPGAPPPTGRTASATAEYLLQLNADNVGTTPPSAEARTLGNNSGLLSITSAVQGSIYLPVIPSTGNFIILDGIRGFLGLQASQGGGGATAGGEIVLFASPSIPSAKIVDSANVLQMDTINGIDLQAGPGLPILFSKFGGSVGAQVDQFGVLKPLGAGHILADTLVGPVTPSSGATAGDLGQTVWDAGNVYICTQAGTAGNAIWKKAALTQV